MTDLHGTEDQAWRADYVVGADPLPAWDRPDRALEPATGLDPGSPVRVLRRSGDWAEVSMASGWTGWVDGQRLEPLTLLDGEAARQLSNAMDVCAAALEEFQRARVDARELQRTLLQHGVVRTDNAVWLLDMERGLWARYDGATVSYPLAEEAAGESAG